MANDFYTHSTYPAPGSQGASSLARAEFDAVSAGFDKMPALSGNAGKFILVNTGANGLVVSSVLTEASGNLTSTGRLYMTNSTVSLPAFSFTGDTNTGVHHPAADNLQLVTAATPGLTVDENSRVFTPQIHNNAAGATGTTPMLASGRSTILLTTLANVSSTSVASAIWSRDGNTVHVAVKVTFTFSLGSTLSSFRLTLPVTSNLGTDDLFGSGSCRQPNDNVITAVQVIGDSVNDGAVFNFYSSSGMAGQTAEIEADFFYEVK